MTIHDWLVNAVDQLRHADIPSARLDAEVLLSYVLQKDRTWLAAHSGDDLHGALAGDARILDSLLARRSAREPIAYLTGHKEFYGREFSVTPDTLIPRPETEDLIELARKHGIHGPLLDVGAGSGCLGITLALELNSPALLSDTSKEALKIARQNVSQLDVKNIMFTQSDLLSNITGSFGLIAANLPYVDRSWQRSPETDFEPALALFADDNGLALIKTLIDQAPSRLTEHGHLLLEADPEQHAAIAAYAKPAFSHIETTGYGVLLQRA